MSKQLTLKEASAILNVAPVTIKRLRLSDNQFPQLSKIGRSVFIDSEAFHKWLSKKSGCVVVEGDRVITAKDLQDIFNKSHTWVWQNVKSKELPTPFKIGRNTFWMNSQIDSLLQQEEVA